MRTAVATIAALIVFVEVPQSGRTRWGFELTMLGDADAPVDDLIIVVPIRTQLPVDIGTGRQYAEYPLTSADLGAPS